ncbi:unnamed protein product [Rodentolepis nana]|uniref:Suf domain-containing protein n=1 Tax=Rodentolepis nana TaxID=102285 RepID=A0A0R3T6T2_RODNA|nr:unnamed protein product [Rodentolepis nana]
MDKIGFGGETRKKMPEVPQNGEVPYPNMEPIPVPTEAVSFYPLHNKVAVSSEPNRAYPEMDDNRIDPAKRLPTF